MTCLTPELPCERNEDCPMEGYACIPGPAQDDPARAALRCLPQVGPDGTAWACRFDEECQTGICLRDPGEPGLCYGACAADEHCPEGYVCSPEAYLVPVERGEAPVPGCVEGAGSFDPCSSDPDCPGAEVCSARIDDTGDGLETVCIEPLTENNPFICQNDAECPTGICIVDPQFGFGSCLIVCQADEECGGFLMCLEAPLVIDGVEGLVRQCVFEMPVGP